MSRTPARFTQADIARTIRAAQQTGAGTVRVLPSGAIEIDPKPVEKEPVPVDSDQEITL